MLRCSIRVFIILQCAAEKCNFTVILTLPKAVLGAVLHGANITDVFSKLRTLTECKAISRGSEHSVLTLR
jgi:hypothetical protein